MRTWALILMSMVSTGCMSAAERDRGLAISEGAKLVYLRDPRTGLCFAARDLSFNSAVVTNVPCTDAVQQLIVTPSAPSSERRASP